MPARSAGGVRKALLKGMFGKAQKAVSTGEMNAVIARHGGAAHK